MELQPYAKSMQQEMIREIEAAHPRYLVFSWINQSWAPKPGSDQGIMTWAQTYVRKCYDPVGVADLIPETGTRFVWDEANVRKYVAESPDLIYVFRRKSDAPCTASE